MELGLIDRLAKEAGYSVAERMSFESHDNCAQRFVGLVAEEIAKLCDAQGRAGGSAADCAERIREAFKTTA